MTRPRVTVRMYKGLRGDCFLLRLFRESDQVDRKRVADAHILIDCGTIADASGGAERSRRIAADIVAASDGRIDLMVVTHNLYDRLSTLGSAPDLLLEPAGITIHHLWLAWTEKVGDRDPDQVREAHESERAAIVAEIDHSRVTGLYGATGRTSSVQKNGEGPAESEPASHRYEFLGPIGLSARDQPSAQDLLSRLKDRFQLANHDYLELGDQRLTPGSVSLRALVLAPPRNLSHLLDGRPDGRYPLTQTRGDVDSFLAAREPEARATERNYAADHRAADSRAMPFSRCYRQISDADLLDQRLTPPPDAAPERQKNLWTIREIYAGKPGERADVWRMIDKSWREPSEESAMRLEADTRNASLVLAFELEPDGDVLLFAGDAQAGNWLSWHKQDYAASEGQVSADDLLARTVFFTFGRPGGRTATPIAHGLDLMSSGRLVAMTSSIEGLLARRASSPQHQKIYDCLVGKTAGRILVGNRRLDQAVLASDEDFSSRVRQGPDEDDLDTLWVEYDVS